MKFLTSVPADKFDEFAFNNDLNHYSKTSSFISLAKLNGYTDGNLLGVENEQGKLLATVVMVHKKYAFLPLQYSYCQYGFNADYKNHELMLFLIENLCAYARKKGSFFLRIDPNIPRLEHEKDGQIKVGGFNNEWFTTFLIDKGFHHLGYNYGYSGNWMSRFTYIKNLDMPWSACLKSIKRQANYNMKNIERHVEVLKGTKSDLHVLVDAQKELAMKLGFFPKKISYFQKFWDIYEPYVSFYIVKTNYHQAKLELEKQLRSAQKHILEVKDQNKVDITKKHIISLEKEIEEIRKQNLDYDKDVYLGAKFIIQQADKVWNVNMYTKKSLLNFRAAFALHMKALEEVYKKQAKTYDFEGIVGTNDPHDPMYGQQNFKKSFGGDYIEYLGEFDYVYNPRKYFLWCKLDHLYRAIRRRLAKLLLHD